MHHLSTSHLDWGAAPSVWAASGNPRSAGDSQGATGQQSPAKLPTSTEADGLEAPTRQKCPPFKGGEGAAIKQWAILNTARTSQLHGPLSCEQSLQCLLPGQVQLHSPFPTRFTSRHWICCHGISLPALHSIVCFQAAIQTCFETASPGQSHSLVKHLRGKGSHTDSAKMEMEKHYYRLYRSQFYIHLYVHHSN